MRVEHAVLACLIRWPGMARKCVAEPRAGQKDVMSAAAGSGFDDLLSRLLGRRVRLSAQRVVGAEVERPGYRPCHRHHSGRRELPCHVSR